MRTDRTYMILVITIFIITVFTACGHSEAENEKGESVRKQAAILSNTSEVEKNKAEEAIIYNNEKNEEEIKLVDTNTLISRYECMDIVKKSELWSGYVQVGDMLFKTDGTMTMKDAVDQLEQSELPLEYDFSLEDMVTSDNKYYVDLNGETLIEIETEKIKEDDFATLGDSMITGIYAGSDAWYPGGISVWSNMKATDIQQYISDRVMSEIPEGYANVWRLNKDNLIHYTFLSEDSAYIILYPFEEKDLIGTRRYTALVIYFDKDMNINKVMPDKTHKIANYDKDEESYDKEIEKAIAQAESGGTAYYTIKSADGFTDEIINMLNENAQKLLGQRTDIMGLGTTFEALEMKEIIVVTEDCEDFDAGNVRVIFEDTKKQNPWRYLPMDYPSITIEPNGNVVFEPLRLDCDSDTEILINAGIPTTEMEYAESTYWLDKDGLDLETVPHEILTISK